MNWTSETTAFLRPNRKEVRPPPNGLSQEDMERVLAEFRQIFKREPTGEEKYELFIEELKLKWEAARGGKKY